MEVKCVCSDPKERSSVLAYLLTLGTTVVPRELLDVWLAV